MNEWRSERVLWCDQTYGISCAVTGGACWQVFHVLSLDGYRLTSCVPVISSCRSFCYYSCCFLGLEVFGLLAEQCCGCQHPIEDFIGLGTPEEHMGQHKGRQGPRGVMRNWGLELPFGWRSPLLSSVSALLGASRSRTSCGSSHLWIWSRLSMGKWGAGWLQFCSIVHRLTKMCGTFHQWEEREIVVCQGSVKGCESASSDVLWARVPAPPLQSSASGWVVSGTTFRKHTYRVSWRPWLRLYWL